MQKTISIDKYFWNFEWFFLEEYSEISEWFVGKGSDWSVQVDALS